MFGGMYVCSRRKDVSRNVANTDLPAPSPPTAEELAQQEAAARQTIFGMLSMCVVLYFCMSSHPIPSL